MNEAWTLSTKTEIEQVTLKVLLVLDSLTFRYIYLCYLTQILMLRKEQKFGQIFKVYI